MVKRSSRLNLYLAACVVATFCATSLGAFPQGVAASSTNAVRPRAIISRPRCAQNARAGVITYVSPYGYDASAGVLDVFVASALGYFKDLCLDVSLQANATDGTELVSAGRATITGEGSAADTLVQIANGANITAIATFGDTSDYALLTEPSITKLTELEGKTIGYKTTMPVVLTEMLVKAGVDLRKVNEVSVGYDPDILVENKVQGLQAYETNEPLTLSAQHHAYREWLPSQFGVKGTFDVDVVNTNFLHDHEDAVADFLRAELHAFSYCARFAAVCVGIEQRFANKGDETYAYSHSLAEWRLEAALATKNTLLGKGVGVQSIAEWMPEEKALLRYGLERRTLDLSRAEDIDLASALYVGTRLIWPGP